MAGGKVVQGKFASPPGGLRGAPMAARMQPVDAQAIRPVGPGAPLSRTVQAAMERLLSSDFAKVRVHVGPQAQRIGAIAFTSGDDIFFAPGRFQPGTHEGLRLIGHELAHVVQQKQGRARPPATGGPVILFDPLLEAEADRAAARVGASLRLSPQAPAVIQRMERDDRDGKDEKRGFFSRFGFGKKKGKEEKKSGPPRPETDEDKIDKLLRAYDASRVYTNTGLRENAESIDRHGLLNQEDRVRTLGNDVYGMSALGGEYKDDEKIGVFFGPKKFYEENTSNMRTNLVRGFLPAPESDRPKARHPLTLQPPSKESYERDRIYYDAKFPGGYVRSDSIPANRMYLGDLWDLLTGDSERLTIKRREMIASIRSNWRALFGEEPPSEQEIIRLCLMAMRRRRLSDAPLVVWSRDNEKGGGGEGGDFGGGGTLLFGK